MQDRSAPIDLLSGGQEHGGVHPHDIDEAAQVLPLVHQRPDIRGPLAASGGDEHVLADVEPGRLVVAPLLPQRGKPDLQSDELGSLRVVFLDRVGVGEPRGVLERRGRHLVMQFA